MKISLTKHGTETDDTVFFHEFRTDMFGAVYCDPILGHETSLTTVIPIPHDNNVSSFLERSTIQFNVRAMEDAALRPRGKLLMADVVKKWYTIFCVGTLDITLEERWLRLPMRHLTDVTSHFQQQFLVWWNALPLYKKMFPVDRLNELKNTHPLSRRASRSNEEIIRGEGRQFEILSGAGKNSFISHFQLNIVTGGFQVHHLQQFRVPTISKRKPPHMLLADGMLPPLHIAVFKRAGHDPHFAIDLMNWGSTDVDKNKSSTSLSDAMAPVLHSWKVDMQIFSNITSRELRQKLLENKPDVTMAVRSTTAMFRQVSEPFVDVLQDSDEPFTREEMSCADRYFDIVLLGEESTAAHFVNPWISL